MNTRDDVRDERLNGSAGAAPFHPIAAILRHRKLVLGIPVAAAALTGVLLAVIPPPYTAVAVLVPSSYQNGGGGSVAPQLPAGLGGLLGSNVNPQQQMLAAVLKSRSLRQRVRELDNKSTPPEILGEALGKGLVVERRPDDGSVAVSVTSKDPEASARLANHFSVAVNEVMGRMAADAAGRKQLFLEKQVEVARERLAASEERMLRFQQTRNVSEPQEQASRTVDAAAEMQSRISQQELVVAQIRRTATEDNPQLRAAVAQLGVLRGQLARLTSSSGSNSVFVPLRQGPELRIASTRLLRQFKENETLYTGLTASLAQARIDANNNLPVIMVMDPATPPTSPSRSTKKLLVLAFLLGGMGAVGLALALEYVRRMQPHAPSTPSHTGGRLGGSLVHH